VAWLGSALLFSLEPLFVKMALPSFGGSPDVWNVAFGCFTVMLLAGYLYAHVLTRLTIRRQVIIHAVVLLAAATLLPVHVSNSWSVSPPMKPELALVAAFLLTIGAPFFALSATVPLTQSWFTLANRSRNPYHLFAASNSGSVVALAAYPFVIEPYAGLSVQSRAWTIGYAVFVAALLVCGALAIVGSAKCPKEQSTNQRGTPPLQGGWRLRCAWVALSAIPTILMIGLTAHLTTETVSLPFVWTMPLGLYLVANAMAFSRWSPKWVLALTPFVVLPVVVLLTVHETLPALDYLALLLVAFFLLALGTSNRLVMARPAPTHLTEFYLYITLGGAIGGILAAFVAPLAFRSVEEYPIAIGLTCLLLPSKESECESLRRWVIDVLIALAFVATTGLLTHFAPLVHASADKTALFWVALAAGLCLTLYKRRVRFGLCIGALLLYGTLLAEPGGLTVASERNFFGPKRIVLDQSHRYHFLLSAGTVHGVQALDPLRESEPLAYYSRSGPLGDVFAAGAKRFARRNVAVVGLGNGSTGCYKTPGQSWTFYEIDPAVVSIATDRRYFSELPLCAPDAQIILGDARLSLERETAQSYGLIVLDAYNSDQVPVHLLTREALAVYLRQLSQDGVLSFHISNRYFDLAPVLAVLARDANLMALERDDYVLSVGELRSGKMASSWVVMTRANEMLPGLTTNSRWHSLAQNESIPLWTDDHSSLMRVVRLEVSGY
jgi:hypothetical protein